VKPIRGIRSSRAPVVAAALLAPLCAVLWSGPSLATSACLKGDATNKLCLDVSSIPGDSVQPSQLAGTPTYVKYTAVLSNTSLATSRYVQMSFDLTPASGFVSFEAEDGITCSLSGSNVSCLVDKITRIDPLSLTLVAEAPRVPTTATAMVNTAVFGFQGNTTTLNHTLAVSSTSGKSYVPAGEEVTIVTEPETADPAEQVTAEKPLWGKVTLPPQPRDYYARVSVIDNGPAMANCVAGVSASATDGGPYVCRSNPRQWVEFDVGETAGAEEPVLFAADNPMQFTMMWDTSIVPSTQLPPSPIAPTGTPAFAVFYAQPERTPPPATVDARAFSDLCDATAPVPPCLTGVNRFDNGDWRASGLKVTDQSDLQSPLAPLVAVLDLLLGRADATGILPPIMD
jgi:hypothetical protein